VYVQFTVTWVAEKDITWNSGLGGDQHAYKGSRGKVKHNSKEFELAALYSLGNPGGETAREIRIQRTALMEALSHEREWGKKDFLSRNCVEGPVLKARMIWSKGL